MSDISHIAVVGSGMAGLTAATLLTNTGNQVTVFEQNWLPGGCSSSYPRKQYIFESGATTLVGLDETMPLGHLLAQTGIELSPWKLPVPMKVYLKNGQVLTRYQPIEQWIEEAERVFGKKGQRAFWTYCYEISQFVWETSVKQLAFPPATLKDLIYALQHFEWKQLGFAIKAFQSMEQLLKKYDLLDNELFVDFVNQQLLITAQNYLSEVNVLFGAAALCYTNYDNFYMPGGLINLVSPFVDFLEANGSRLKLEEGVNSIVPVRKGYELQTNKGTYHFDKVVSSIPINNTLSIFKDDKVEKRLSNKVMSSDQLNSALSIGFVMKKTKMYDCLHHQIHLSHPLPYTGSESIFLSLSHPEDHLRCGPDEIVGSISTHVPHPAETWISDKDKVEELIFKELATKGLLSQEDITYVHSSTPHAWEKWTQRKWGFVGGYPQYMKIKPWEMIEARLDHKGAYICGDSAYPGQGIPGACLSGIIAFEKMCLDDKGVLHNHGEKSSNLLNHHQFNHGTTHAKWKRAFEKAQAFHK